MCLAGLEVVFALLCLTFLPLFHSSALAAEASPQIALHQGTTTQHDWNMFSFNSSRYDPYEQNLTTQNVSHLKLGWSVNPTQNEECSSVAASNGIVYLAPEGEYNANVYALKASSGQKVWSVSRKNLSGCSSPAVVNGVVYVSSGEVDALNATTGKLLWSNNTLGAITSPVVANGLLYVGTNANQIVALKTSTGAVSWSATLGGSINTISATVANGVLYIGAYDNNLYAFNATTGKQLWVVSTGGYVYSTPAVDGGKVYIVSNGRDLEAFNATTGGHLWTVTSPVNGLDISPAAANGIVYYCVSQSVYSTLQAYDETSGKLLWTSELSTVQFAPAIANGVVYASFFDSAGIAAFDAKTGKTLFSEYFTNQGQGATSPTVDNGTVYIGTSYGNLDAFRLA
jgi:outer membrane protein assembly factor BamB